MMVSEVGRTISGSSSSPVGPQLAVRAGFQAVMGDDRAFLGEALDVRGFLLHEGQRDEQREVGVLVAGGLEHVVQRALHVLPERVAPRLDDHAAAHGGVLGQVGGADDLLVPLGVVLFAGGRDRGFGGLAGLGVGGGWLGVCCSWSDEDAMRQKPGKGAITADFPAETK